MDRARDDVGCSLHRRWFCFSPEQWVTSDIKVVEKVVLNEANTDGAVVRMKLPPALARVTHPPRAPSALPPAGEPHARPHSPGRLSPRASVPTAPSGFLIDLPQDCVSSWIFFFFLPQPHKGRSKILISEQIDAQIRNASIWGQKVQWQNPGTQNLTLSPALSPCTNLGDHNFRDFFFFYL